MAFFESVPNQIFIAIALRNKENGDVLSLIRLQDQVRQHLCVAFNISAAGLKVKKHTLAKTREHQRGERIT